MRLRWIDAARGLAMLMVVLVHTIDWAAMSGQRSEVLLALHIASASIMLPLFFFISGLLARRVLSLPWPQILERRIIPLAWVYVLWQPLTFAYKYAAGQILPGQLDTSLSAHLLRLVAFPVRPSGELWFLWALIIYLVAFKLLGRLPRAVHVLIAVAPAVAWPYVLTLLPVSDAQRLLGPGINGLPLFYVYFVLGVLGAPELMTKVGSLPRVWTTLPLLTWGAMLAFAIIERIDEPSYGFVFRTVGLVAGVGLATLLVDIRVLCRVGESSMGIYLAHTSVIVLVLIAFQALSILQVPWPPPQVLVLALLGVAAGLALFAVATKPAWRWLIEPPRALMVALKRHVLQYDSGEEV